MRIERYEKDTWKELAESAHQICFEEKRSINLDRVDFALFAITHSGIPAAYVTCRETDSESLYWQYGGAFPSVKGTVGSYNAYTGFYNWTKERYKRVNTLIENKNSKMLKMAASVGFIITGIKNFNGTVLLEHSVEFENG